VSGELIPEIWSAELTKQMHKKMAMEDVLKQRPVVLSLGPNIGLTAEQVNDAIRDEATDPIIRDALIAFKAKMRITDTPPVRVRVDKIYGFKPLK
jgi:hypothetical protein